MRKSPLIKIILLLAIFLTAGFFNSADFIYGQTSEHLNSEIKEISTDIQNKKSDIKKIQDKQKELESVIAKKQNEKASLNNQLAILDNRLAKSELDIKVVETEIERTKLEIRKTDLEITGRQQEIEREKVQIATILKLIYRRDNVTALEILLLNESLAAFLNQVKYLEDMNENVAESLKKLEKLKQNLEKEKEALDKQNQELAGLKKDLQANKNNLAAEKDSKAHILVQVRQSEQEFQRLLSQAKKEQEQAAAEIASMEKVMRAKLAKLQGGELQFNDSGFAWPITKNVITAYFRDPDYPFRYIFEHPGVDIRAAQGSPVKAAASGYVARAKDAGRGYSYIMLVHGDGLSTVYGHISKITVKEEDFVVQGQTIGLSGGLPGTPGAGGLTTGPHLHFEIRSDGIPVDPLGYLP